MFVLQGGFAISDEMCVNYVHYYPLVDLEVCKSSVATRPLNTFFNFMNKYVMQFPIVVVSIIFINVVCYVRQKEFMLTTTFSCKWVIINIMQNKK